MSLAASNPAIPGRVSHSVQPSPLRHARGGALHPCYTNLYYSDPLCEQPVLVVEDCDPPTGDLLFVTFPSPQPGMCNDRYDAFRASGAASTGPIYARYADQSCNEQSTETFRAAQPVSPSLFVTATREPMLTGEAALVPMNLEFEDGALGREAAVERASSSRRSPHLVDVLRWMPNYTTTINGSSFVDDECSEPAVRLTDCGSEAIAQTATAYRPACDPNREIPKLFDVGAKLETFYFSASEMCELTVTRPGQRWPFGLHAFDDPERIMGRA